MADISSHHIGEIQRAHQRLDSHAERLGKLETSAAAAEVRSTHIQESLGKIENGITWITRLVIGGIIAGAVAFIISGGLHV